MTFSTGSNVVKMKLTEDDVSAMVAESREACKRLRKLGMIRKTVATHRVKELRHLRAVEKIATPWRCDRSTVHPVSYSCLSRS